MKQHTWIGFVAIVGLVAVGCAQPQPEKVEAPPAPEPVRQVLTAEAQQGMTPAEVLAGQRAVCGRETDPARLHGASGGHCG